MNAADPTLPILTDARRDEIEATLFARIADERTDAAVSDARSAALRADHARVRAVRRGRVWMGAAAAAAFVAVAAVIAPQLSAGSGGSISAVQPATGEGSGPAVFDAKVDDGAAGSVAPGAASSEAAAREVVATATASVTVNDTRAAVDRITAAAASAGGYVESVSFGGGPLAYDTMGGVAPVVPSNPTPTGAWISVRVPADALTATVSDLSEIGDVTSTQVDRRDVTTETVDLRARVASLEASVARLTELMGQSSTTSDLIAAESALAERQSELDSLRQQLTWLDTQVAMSTLTVNVAEPAPATTANPAGFGEGIAAGWNALVATLNGLVVAIGFLLPWLGVVVVLALVIWAVRRLLRRRAGERYADPGSDA